MIDMIGVWLIGTIVGCMAGVEIGIWLAERRVRWIADYVGSRQGRGLEAANAAGEIVRCMESSDWHAAAGGR